MTEAVHIVEYSPNWPTLYEQEKKLIVGVLGHAITDIQHIGSTAVPGLGAKPIIDILVAAHKRGPVEEYSGRLRPIGYRHQSHEDDAKRLFFQKGTPRTHHLHIVEYDSWEYRRHILFRDCLRTHPETAQRYEKLKRELAIKFASDREDYTESKSEFIESVVDRAIAEGA